MIALKFSAVIGLPEVAALAIWLDDNVSFPDAVALSLPDPGPAAEQPPDLYAPVGPAAPAQSLDPPGPPSKHSGEGPALQPPVPAGVFAIDPAAGDPLGPPPPGFGQPPAPQAGAAAAGPASVPRASAGAPAVTPQRPFELETDAAGSGSPVSPTPPTAALGQAASPAADPSAASLQASGPAYGPAAAPDVGTAAAAPRPILEPSARAPVAVPEGAAANAPPSGGPAAAPASPGRAPTPEPPEPSPGAAAAAAGPRPAAEPALPPAAWSPPENFLQVMRWPPATDPARMEIYADASLPALPGLVGAQLAPADLSAPLDMAGAYGAAGGGGGAPPRARGQALFMWLAIYSGSPSAPLRSSDRREKSSKHERVACHGME